jgi:proteic killer suppression protein
VIKSFADKRTLAIASGIPVKSLPQTLQQAARDRLITLGQIEAVEDLRLPPSNRLEKLVGDRAGQWSIRVNRQWRICFDWRDGSAWNVELVDYH